MSKRIKDNTLVQFFSLLPAVIKMSPTYFIVFMVSSILHGITWGLIVIYNQHFFDSAKAFSEHKVDLIAVISALLMLSLIQVAKHVLNGVANYVPIVLKSIINREFTFRFHAKMKNISPVRFEDTTFLDSIEKANKGKSEIAWNTITFFSILFFYIPYFIFMSSYLFRLQPVLLVCIIAVFIPVFITQLVRTQIFAKVEDKAAPIQRENAYYESCIVSRDYFKETRMLGGFPFFIGLFQRTQREMNQIRLRANVKASLINLLLQLLGLTGYVGILLLLFGAVIKGEISIGSFAAVFQGVNDIYKLMEELIYSHVGGMTRDLGYIKNYTAFMRSEEWQGTGQKAEVENISVSDVSFQYPGSDRFALKNINLNIRKNEIVAIVGENGSGKTTLVRLISGLYLPQTGHVRHGASDTKELSMSSLFDGVSAVFQNYQKYMMTLRDNITISDTSGPVIQPRLDAACRQAGISDTDTCFTFGYDTMLSREFDGVDLSGGQWQRIALARGFYRSYDTIILDEPTAAIDPIEETNLYNRFIEMARGKTAMIVTHRLGSVKLADRIIVMSRGEIIGNGPHEELLKTVPEYARMFYEQQKWYS